MGNRDTYDARYLRAYRRENPQKAEQWRITAEINHLESNGFTVTKQKQKPKQPEEMTLAELEERIERDREQKRQYNRKWRSEHREHLREYFKQYRREHPERFKSRPVTEKSRKYKAQWRAEHRDEINAYQRQWNKDRRERIRKALEKARQEQKGSERE